MHKLTLAVIVAVFSSLPLLGDTIHVPEDHTTIQTALNWADSGDTVLVACGVYYEHDIAMNYTKSGVYLLSESGDPNCVVIDAQGLGRVLQCWDIDNTGLIRGLTFRSGDEYHGGGVLLIDSSVPFHNCIFESNTASEGAGLRGNGSCSPEIVECEFRQNVATQGGGGIRIDSGAYTISKCVFSENHGSLGGGIQIISGTPVAIDCEFHGNSAEENGGGIYIAQATTDALISKCLFSANTSDLTP